MKTFAITGRTVAAPPAADWREQLAVMLGERPRRIGVWAELGLYGALRCMETAGEKELPPGALLMLGSRRGTHVPTAQALEQMRDGLPMPFTFLQTQPSQLLAMLAARLRWRGQAVFLASTGVQAMLQLAVAQSGQDGMLIGWVEEEGASSYWLRLRPCADAAGGFHAAAAEAIFSTQISHLSLVNTGVEVRTVV
jgi:hypothetical protein